MDQIKSLHLLCFTKKDFCLNVARSETAYEKKKWYDEENGKKLKLDPSESFYS